MIPSTADYVILAVVGVIGLIVAYQRGWLGLGKLRPKSVIRAAPRAVPNAPASSAAAAQPVDLMASAIDYVTKKRQTESALDAALEVAAETEAVRLAAQNYVSRRAAEMAPTILHRPTPNVPANPTVVPAATL